MENVVGQCISFDGMYDSGTFMYMASGIFNGMLQVDKCTGEAKYVIPFENEDTNQKGLCHRVYRYQNYLVFTPDNAKNVHIYDLESNKMQYYPIPIKNMHRRRCIDSALIGNELWLFFAYVEQPVIIFDLRNMEMREFVGITEALPREISERKSPVFWNQFTKYNDEIYGAVWDSSYIVKLNTVTQKVEVLTISGEPRKLCALAYDGVNFWFAELGSNKVFRWDGGEEVLEYLSAEFETRDSFIYNNIIFCYGKIVIIPNAGREIYYVDGFEESVKTFCALPDEFSELKDERRTWRRFYSYDIKENMIHIYPANANMQVNIDVERVIAEGIVVTLDLKNDEGYKNNILYPSIERYNVKGVIPRTKDIGLKEYLEYLTDYKK